MLDDFLVRAALAGIGIALATGMLGCFVVWRRMAFFGDATAHAAILGVALALAVELPIVVGVLIVAVGVAFAISALDRRGQSMDTLLGVISHGSLALGLVAVAFLPGVRIDLTAFLFGDILAVSRGDLAVIWGGSLLVLGLLAWRWNSLLTSTLNPDLAYASGIDPRREKLVLTTCLAVVVAVALQVIGALLITALLILPAAAARPLVKTPEGMALAACTIGVISALGGLGASWHWDTPAGPSIVVSASAIFAVAMLVTSQRN